MGELKGGAGLVCIPFFLSFFHLFFLLPLPGMRNEA
jgi:hypothetical protein